MNGPELIYTSPIKFSFRQRLFLATAPRLTAWALRTVGMTCRFEMRSPEYAEESIASRGHVLLAIWHETLGLAALRYRGTDGHTLTSYSFDGEFAAQVIRQMGLRAVRGSSSRGGSEALRQLELACQRAKIVGFTLDGPRGPRREAKPGIAILAARTGLPVVPNAFAVTRAWRMHSWDRLALPKFGARVVCAYGAPIPAPPSADLEAIEECRKAVELSLNALHTDLERETETSAALGL